MQNFAMTLKSKSKDRLSDTTLDAKSSDQMEDMKSLQKRRIRDKTGLPAGQQRLIFPGISSVDGKTIQKDSRFHFVMRFPDVPSDSSSIPIMVRSLVGRSFALEVEPTDRIEDLKAKIQEQTGIPTESQRLIFKGRRLQEGDTVGDYSIPKNATLNLVQRIVAGF
jgi:ubiquitin C